MTTAVEYETRVLSDRAELFSLVDEEVGVSAPFEITQARVNLFAAATEDFQWIHVDERRAREFGPFGGTIVHGYLTLALVPKLLFQVVELRDTTVINAGVRELKFLSPVRVGSSVQLSVCVEEVTQRRSGIFVTYNLVMRVIGQERPAFTGKIDFVYSDAVG